MSPENAAIWRFGVISPLINHTFEGITLKHEIEKLAAQTFVLPDYTQISYSQDTIRHWLYLYRKHGLVGLHSKIRKDKGSTSLPLDFQDALKTLRTEHPEWTIKRITNHMKEQNLWNGRKPSRSAIYRFTANQDLGRNPAQKQKAGRSFAFAHFGDLWSADFLHGPKVMVKGKERKVYLHAIIDDATRYIVYARFHLTEGTEALMNDFQRAIQRFGVPKRFYTDNGSAFKSKHLMQVAARIGIALPHTPPGRPQGRGKIERFFRTVRDGFLTGKGRCSLKKINEDFDSWIGGYHSRIHSGLGESPLNRKLSDSTVLKQLDAVQNIDKLFRMEVEKTVYSDGCIKLKKKRYDVPGALVGQKIKVSYVPWDLSEVYTDEDNTVLKPLDTVKNAHRFNNPKRKK
jgi:transposase InsO family protein